MRCQERVCKREATGTVVLDLEFASTQAPLSFDLNLCEPCRLKVEDAKRFRERIEAQRDVYRAELREVGSIHGR